MKTIERVPVFDELPGRVRSAAIREMESTIKQEKTRNEQLEKARTKLLLEVERLATELYNSNDILNVWGEQLQRMTNV